VSTNHLDDVTTTTAEASCVSNNMFHKMYSAEHNFVPIRRPCHELLKLRSGAALET